MRLYYSPGSCALSPHIVAREAGLDVEIEKVVFSADGRRTQEHDENFYDVNPRGYVPALKLDSGDILTEGVAIVQYLADQAPGAGLMPKHQSGDYYKALSWLTFISSEVHKGFSPFFRSNLPEEEKKIALDRLLKRFDWINGALEGNDYLVGGAFSIADAYCYTILRWHPKAGIDLGKYPNIKEYYERIGSRPAVKTALKEEGLE
ncbi:MAG TPA: glutathione transferase GstA [Candidatus Paceibacterota bacterium]|nr:glutathione transferase GstA [Candidatus Paceibacterota bacterium]